MGGKQRSRLKCFVQRAVRMSCSWLVVMADGRLACHFACSLTSCVCYKYLVVTVA